MASRVEAYSALAEIYDEVMSHVDYDQWAEYLERLVRDYASAQTPVLELGCGTASLAVRLVPALNLPYTASDNSPEMLAVARRKLSSCRGVRIKLIDFRQLPQQAGPESFGTVILAYDGINYARDLEELQMVLNGTFEILVPAGIFLFDQATPSNSINNLPYFGDEFQGEGYSYERSSTYDRKSRIHTTRFVIQKGDSVVNERHIQRAFTRIEMLEAVRQAGFVILESFEAFGFDPADDDTERIQWIIQKPEHTT